MKKLLLIIFILFILFSNASAGSCLIKNGSSDGLNSYLTNLRNILQNISSQARSEKGENNESIYNYGVKVFNDAFNFRNFFNEVKFFSFYGKFQEIPEEVQRDYNKLKNEDSSIKIVVENVSKNNLDKVKVKNICSGINGVCNFKDGDNLGDVLKNVAQNHENIKNVFVKISTGQKDFNKNNFILVDDNFFQDIETNYSKENSIACSKEEGGFWDTISKRTTEIFSNEKSAKEGIKKWKEAWNLLTGVDTMPKEQYEAIERELLKKELSRQGVSGNNQENVLNSLDKYNQDGFFSLNNNFVSNTFKNTTQKFKNEIQNLKNEVVEDFFENARKKSKEKGIPIKEVSIAKENSDTIKEKKSDIHSLYTELSRYTARSEFENDNLRTRLISTHVEISNSINTLIETCKKAVKICNQQDSGNGDCGDCNW